MTVMPSRCPVPAEQQPINEYQDMRESWFYSWGSRSLLRFIQPLVVLWGLSWSMTAPIAAASFTPARYPSDFLLSAAIGACVLPCLALLQLYIGWSHVGRRLRQARIPYEESGWYDGQVWQKPEDMHNRDRLIVDYQVQPILHRLRRSFAAIVGLLAVAVVAWQWI
ncbi:hypothetical protein XM38_047990 [Halomicronema hongdechloris C2206]|uniref:Ycf36 protein n=1 Tax=Halomicronema hongdechloris C2206 TaxID=1641165 RepID=A0A1Z3HU68_9CYAN|nr:CGLD27 family protein [Halomicronema hongdechloris]ASC73826.1 hypothetical protein XM38_047990 [Halomicronema hongdechloris C2206]